MPQHPNPGDGMNARPSAKRPEPDAHGQAALLLAEATLHALVETRALSNSQAVAVVRTASEVKVEVADEIGESDGRMRQSINLLSRIEQSLMTDNDFRADNDGAA